MVIFWYIKSFGVQSIGNEILNLSLCMIIEVLSLFEILIKYESQFFFVPFNIIVQNRSVLIFLLLPFLI